MDTISIQAEHLDIADPAGSAEDEFFMLEQWRIEHASVRPA